MTYMATNYKITMTVECETEDMAEEFREALAKGWIENAIQKDVLEEENIIEFIYERLED